MTTLIDRLPVLIPLILLALAFPAAQWWGRRQERRRWRDVNHDRGGDPRP